MTRRFIATTAVSTIARTIPKRCTVLVACALVVSGAVPAVATAAQSLSVSSPTGFPAGGDPSVTLAINLDSGVGAPSAITLTLAPGVLASLAANPACLSGPPQQTAACEIGGGTVTMVGLFSIPFSAYLTPPSGVGAVAGVDVIALGIRFHSDLYLSQTSNGNLAATMFLDLSKHAILAALISGMRLTINGTVNGKAFLRMPTSCTPGSTSMTVNYASATETSTASPDFTPTGCSSLPYSPQLSGSATKDRSDTGVAVSATIRQAAGQAASRSATLKLPASMFVPNLSALGLLNSRTPVGTVTAASPLVPDILTGQVFLTGSLSALRLTFKFPAPIPLVLTGDVDLARNSMTFTSLPDIPLSSFAVSFAGGPQALFLTGCTTPRGTLSGSFVGQNGITAASSKTLTVANCGRVSGRKVTRPTVSGRFSGLGAARPSLRFSLTRGTSAVRSFTVSLPGGLSFKRTQLRSGLVVTGARTFTARITGGKLMVTVRSPARRLSVSIRSSTIAVSTPLARRLRHRQVTRLTARVSVTDASGGVTALTVG